MQSPHPFNPAEWRRRLSTGVAGLALFSAWAGAASAQPAESRFLARGRDLVEGRGSRAHASSRRGAVSRLRAACACAVALVLMGGAAPAALGHSHQSAEVERLSIDQLKRFYLWCGRAATAGQLDNGAIMQCSVFYEALKERAFGGDFERLLAWSRENSDPGAGASVSAGER